MMRESDRLADEFMTLISHELRTPLTSIIGYLELTLDDGNLTEEQRGYLDVVDHNADRLLRLVDDLLLVAQLEAGQLVVRRVELDLAEVARQAVAEAQPSAAAKNITLTVDADAAIPLQADKGRVFRTLGNLLSNAIKFTPAGGDVQVSVSHADGVVRLEVADTGIGIATDDQERLFDRFFRTSAVAEQHFPGTGLGLYIAQSIVQAHGGSITVRSEPGKGASFSVALPTGVSEVPALDAIAIAEAANGLDRHTGGILGRELASQVPDVELHLVARDTMRVAPDELQQLIA
jgi:signal transduction histidine kinase